MGSLETLRNEWAGIDAAPWSFILAVAAVFATAFLVLNWRYGGIIASLKERIDAKDAQIKDLQARGVDGTAESIQQAGTLVATVLASRISQATKSVTFGQVFAGPHFDPDKEFEFRGHRLTMRTHSMAAGFENEAGETDMTYTSMVCDLVS